ncbi:mucin-4-like [Harpia harpyja]|uniref:mucin-4-like n=1 Tax=Harpia harpyja TaxID=202280 RepID=UPI0022B0D0E2|nr:mucin-4-like [Harpia harpyja]
MRGGGCAGGVTWRHPDTWVTPHVSEPQQDPAGGAPTPGVTPPCPRSTPPPPPSPPPLPPDCLPQEGDAGDPGDGGAEAPGDATTVVGRVTASQGGDDVMVGTHGDVAMGGTEGPGVTEAPGDALGHATEAPRDATTVVGHVTASQGGDKVMVATHGDVAMEGTDQPGVTEAPGDALGHGTEAPGDATTVAGGNATSQGGDDLVAAARGDVVAEGPCVTDDPVGAVSHVTVGYAGDTAMAGCATAAQGGGRDVVAREGGVPMGGTTQADVTDQPGDNPGHVTAGYAGDVTTVGRVTATQGSDEAAVAHGGDVLVEGTDQPGVTEDPGDTLGHATEAPRDATTVVGPIATSQGGDKVMVGTHGDVAMGGTDQSGVTSAPGDTLGHVTEVYRDATTTVGPVTTSQGGDNVMVGTHGDVTMEGTDQPSVTEDPGDTLSHVTDVYRDATTMVGHVTTSQGGDDVMVGTRGDVLVEGTEGPGVTNCSGDVTTAYRGDTTTVGPVTVSQGCDTAAVAHSGDVLVEGTEGPGVTRDPGDTLGHATEVYRDATTVAGPVTMSQGGDNVMVGTHGDVAMEGTDQPGVTEDPGDTLSHVTDVYRDATTMVGHVTTSQGGDKVMVGTRGDVLVEGTERPGVPNCSGDTLGHVTEVYRDPTTTVGPVTMSQGGDSVMVGSHRDVTMEGTEEPGVTEDPGATLGDVTMVYRGDTTTVGDVTVSQGGDNVMVGTQGDVLMGGTDQPGVTSTPGDTLGHITEVYRDATTVVGPVTVSQGGDNVMVGSHRDVTMEGTEEPGVTEDPGATLGDVTMVYRGDDVMVGPVTVSQEGDKAVVAQGGDDAMVGTHGDVALGGTAQPGATEAPGDATTVVGPVATSQGGDDVTAATRGDVAMEATAPPAPSPAPRPGHGLALIKPNVIRCLRVCGLEFLGGGGGHDASDPSPTPPKI